MNLIRLANNTVLRRVTLEKLSISFLESQNTDERFLEIDNDCWHRHFPALEFWVVDAVGCELGGFRGGRGERN